MKLVIIFSLILTFNFSHIFAQENKDSLRIDSIKTDISNKKCKKDFLSYANKVNADDFNKGVVFSPMQLIQGKIPGFVINCPNANDPNPILQIQSRGISTLCLSTEPLYIIDGIPLESQDIILPENIESIEVLKSLSETAPYGIRGANGVVIIKTKKNSSRKLTVSYNTYLYTESYAQKSDYMSATEWRQLKQDLTSSSFSLLTDKSKSMIDYGANTDWQKEISQNKLSQAHNIGFSGGYKKTSYSAIFNYNNYNGILLKTGNTTYSGQFSVSQLALKDKLQVDLSVIGTSKKYSEINNNSFLSSVDYNTGMENANIISIANHYNPTVPLYNTDGNYGRDTSYVYSIIYNPVNQLKNITDKRKLTNILAHIRASYEIMNGLKFSTSYSAYKITADNLFSKYYQVGGNEILSETNEANDKKERLYALKLDYKKLIDFHNFDLSLDYSNQCNENNYKSHDSVIVYGTDYPTGSYDYYGTKYKIRNISGSIKYDYKSKYFLSFGILKETCGLYNPHGSTEYYPNMSAMWSLGNEAFLKNTEWLNELNVRVGYGTGKRQFNRDNISRYTIYNFSPNLHGEKMREGNFGVDVSLLSNRLCFSASYYNRKTKDGVEIIDMPTSSDQLSIKENNAEIQNKGWEFYLKSQPLVGHIKWKFDFNISINKNIILSDAYYSNKNIKGQPVGNFYGYQFAGYSDSNEMLIIDINGNTTTNLSSDSRKILGNGMPKSFFGFTNKLENRNFDLSIFVKGALGFDIKNLSKQDFFGENNFRKTSLTADQRNMMNLSISNTDFIIEKGDYLKIDNILIGYTMPFEKRFIKSAKVYIGCNNVALFTKFTGGDPEMAGITGVNPGYYYEKYPRTRIFLFGIKIIM